MSTATYDSDFSRGRRRDRGPGLVGAEFLKLRKRRGLVLTAFALTVVPMVVGFTVTTILHASDPAKHPTAGGLDNYTGAFGVFSLLATVAAVLVGVTAGTGDVGAGVFRELVVTGRSRLQLFAARIPGGLALLLPLVLAALAVAAGASAALAGSADAPSAELIAQSGAWILVAAASTFAVALGLATVIGSRAAIGLLLAWQLAVSPLLLSIDALGSVRRGFMTAALQNLAPDVIDSGSAVPMSPAAAVVVVVAWVGAALGLGAWKPVTRDA